MAIEPGVIAIGLLEGGLAAICFMYALQTRVPYPTWAIRSLDQPWIITIAIVLAFLLYSVSPKASILSLLIIIAFAIDIYIFTRHPIATKNAPKTQAQATATASTRTSSSGLWGTDAYGWWIADGSVESMSPMSLQTMGEPVAAIPLSEPIYPLYHADFRESTGLASFI